IGALEGAQPRPQLVELVAHRTRAGQAAQHLLDHALLAPAEEHVDDVLLAEEVAVDRPGRDAGLAGDLRDRGAVIAAIGEQPQRGVEDLLTLAAGAGTPALLAAAPGSGPMCAM